MRILFLSHYFPPEVNAPATRTFEHCRRWAEAGHDVTVVTCAPNCPDGVVYPGYTNRLCRQVESVDGVRVVRVWTHLAANHGAVGRIVNFLSFMLSAVLASIRLPRPDVVVATSPQFFCGWAGVLVSRLKQAPLVLEIRDIWPDSIWAVGAMRGRWLQRILEMMERWMYQSAHHIVALGQGYRANILRKTSIPDRISVIPNGVDVRRFVPREPDAEFLRTWGLENKFVCSYVGTIGMAHGLEVVLEAAKILRQKGRHDIAFCFVGEGSHRKRLEADANQAGLNGTVAFTGRQRKEEIAPILASSDACLIHLKRCQLFGTVIPSKIFETLAMARPIIIGVRGEARDIVMEAGAGVEMEPDCPESLVEAVEELARDRLLRRRLCSAGRTYVEEHFNRDVLATRFLRLLEAVAEGRVPRAQREPTVEAEFPVPRRKAA